MAQTTRGTLQVRGALSLDKIKAAQVLGGEDLKFELRAMRPVKAGQLASSCIVCLICIICVVCAAARAREAGIRLREELAQT
jgi:hypothetical protein